MIEALISSRTRVKLLMKFFLNGSNESYLRSLEQEFGESTNAIRLELNRLSKAGMLTCTSRGNKKYFKANEDHPFYDEIHSILLKQIGVDRIVDEVIRPLDQVDKVYLTGRLANGINSQLIDLMIIGHIDATQLTSLIEKAEAHMDRKIRYIAYEKEEEVDTQHFRAEPLLIWSSDTSEEE